MKIATFTAVTACMAAWIDHGQTWVTPTAVLVGLASTVYARQVSRCAW